MALTDNERGKNEKRKKNRPVDAKTNLRWSDQQKLEAVNSYLALGNLALVSRITGIPEITLRVWKASDWWKDVVDDVQRTEKIQLSNRMKQLVEASQRIVAQRLETGDPILNQKTGQIEFKPVSMKDAHKVAVDLIDRQTVIEKALRNDQPQSEENDNNKLEKLAEKFAEMATMSIQKNFDKKRTIEVTDAVYEERETRLQDGVPEISFEAGTNQESDGEDDSEATS